MKDLLLTNFPATKEQQELVAQRWVEKSLAGEVNPLEAEAWIVAVENTIKAYRSNKELRQHLVDEVEKLGGKAVIGSTTITLTETSVNYDYSDSAKWREIDRTIEGLTEKRKRIETALKNASEDTPFDDGNFNKITHIEKTSKKTIKVNVAKS